MKKRNGLLRENIYGHSKRFSWIISNLKDNYLVVEFGCGTGCMITLQLTNLGYNVLGIDLDELSINYGKKVFVKEGLNPDRLLSEDISRLNCSPDAIISSEVLEHIPKRELPNLLEILRQKVKPEGLLLVTVPNGYGWFELESFLWYKLGLGRLLERLKITLAIHKLKSILFGRDIVPPYLSTLADSPHVQRFTFKSIQKTLKENGFRIEQVAGSVFFAGPFSDLFFTGIKPVMSLNCKLGSLFPRIAAGFYVKCRVKPKEVSK